MSEEIFNKITSIFCILIGSGFLIFNKKVVQGMLKLRDVTAQYKILRESPSFKIIDKILDRFGTTIFEITIILIGIIILIIGILIIFKKIKFL